MKQHLIQYHSVSRETFSAVDKIIEECRSPLSDYFDQLLWWNKRVNLVSRDVPRETVWEHIRHSLLLSQLPAFRSTENIVDAGTGGGLPGLPLAITHPEKSFVLNDIVSKKCLAVKQIVRKLGLQNIVIFDGSVADLEQQDPFILISKHAFKIDELYELTGHLPWQKMVFYKGVNFEDELENISEDLKVSAYDLYAQSNDFFYKDKAIVIIKRRS